jgi:hypothetical protein
VAVLTMPQTQPAPWKISIVSWSIYLIAASNCYAITRQHHNRPQP